MNAVRTYPRFYPEFLWEVRGQLGWHSAEHPTCLSMADVVEVIGDNHDGLRCGKWRIDDRLDPRGYMLRVTKVEDGTERDVTDEALIAYGTAHAEATDDWPDMLMDLCPQKWRAA